MSPIKAGKDSTIMLPARYTTHIPYAFQIDEPTRIKLAAVIDENELFLSYHISRGADTTLLVWDGLRTRVPRDFPYSSSQAYCELAIETPNTPGVYIVKPDLVEENVTWFGLDLPVIQLTVVPEKERWDRLPSLPVAFSEPLSKWSNTIEYRAVPYSFGQDHSINPREILVPWVAAILIERLDLNREARIVDYCTGNGKYRLSLRAEGFHNVYGVDISAEMLEDQKRLERALKFETHPEQLIQADSVLDLPSASFDVFLMGSGLHHIVDLDAHMSEVTRVLKPGGYFLALDEPSNKRWFHELREGPEAQHINVGEVYDICARQAIERTHSTIRFAEFWDGVGFSRSNIQELFTRHGMVLAFYEHGQFLSYLWQHLLASHVTEPEIKKSLEQDLNDIDQRLLRCLPDAVKDTAFLTTYFAGQKTPATVLER